MDKSIHTRAVGMAMDDMKKTIDSMDSPAFMSSGSPETTKRKQMFDAMAPDLKALLDGGMPMYMVEKLARGDLES